MCFNNQPLSRSVDICLKLFHIRHKEHHIKQLVDVLASFCTNLNHNNVAAPFLWVKVVFTGKLRLYHLRISGFFVNLVNRNNNFCISRASKANRFNSLWLHAVISSNHDNHNVSKGCPMLTKGGEGFVARGVKQGNRAIATYRLIGTNMLGNTPGFTINNFLAQN